MKNRKSQHLWVVVFIVLGTVPDVLTLNEDQPSTELPRCSGISRGKHFILGFIDNFDRQTESRGLSILVVAFSDQQTTVTISSKHQLAGKPFLESFVVEAGGFRRTSVPVELTMVDTERSFKGIEISASSEASVYGLMYQDYTTDGFLGIPTNNLGMQYVIVTSRPNNEWPSQFAVIGSEDFTSVQVTLRGTVTFEGQTYNEDDVLNFMVNKLEAVHIQGQLLQDLTGSIIQTDKPVSVFSGNKCASNPGSYCDTLTEQLVPVQSWGQRHIYTSAQSTDTNIYRIVAYFIETNVTIPGLQVLSLNAGEFWEGSLSGSGLVYSSKPALMMQLLASVNGLTVDPSLTQVLAEEQFGFVFGFTTPPHSGGDSGGYFNFISIIVKRNARQSVFLNGSPINATDVVEYEVPNTDYTAITVPLPKGEGVYFVEQTDPLSSPLSVIVYGYEQSESYGYAAGLSLPSNEQLLSFTPFYLRELGGEVFKVTVPCLETNDILIQNALCRFSSGIGDVLVPGDRVDSYTVVCITPTFYRIGLTSVYVSLDGGSTFPYSGVVYVAPEEDLPSLLNVIQVNSENDGGIIDLTLDDPITLSWNPKSVGEDTIHVTVMAQTTNSNSDGYPVLMERTILKSSVLNNGTLTIIPADLKPLLDDGVSVSAFYLIQSEVRRQRDTNSDYVDLKRVYSGVTGIFKSVSDPCEKYISRLKHIPTGLSPCPCTSTQAIADSLNFKISNHDLAYYHPGATNCYRSTTPSPSGSGQQCCYGKDGNILVGPPGGGTADRYSPTGLWNTLWHWWYDVRPWVGCCKKSNNCYKYYKYRPSDDCSEYEPPRPAGGTGDPHLTSLDGKKFTFNGAGEFLMASSALHNLTFQARMERYRNTNASVYTAIVLQTNDSAKVQVQMSNMNETLILVDGEPLRHDSSPIRVHYREGLRISYNPDLSEVRIAFKAGIAVIVYIQPEVMSFIAQLETKFRGQVKGLLGNLNGDPDDDLQFPNGTIMRADSTLQEIHELGLEWLVAQEDSIFTYISPFDYSTYHFPDFSPTFEVPDLDQVSQEIKDLCGDSVECVFDAVTTGSLAFANETLVVTDTIKNVQEASVKVVSCGFPGAIEDGVVSGSVYLVNATVHVTCDDGFSLDGSPRLTCQSDGQWSSNLPRCSSVKQEDEGLSTLAIALIAVGSSLLFLVTVGLIYLCFKKSNKISNG